MYPEPSDDELRAFEYSRGHFTEHSALTIGISEDADTKGPLRNGYRVENGIVYTDICGVSNPVRIINNRLPVTIMGKKQWWDWPQDHVRWVRSGEGKLLYVNPTHYPQILHEKS